MLLKVHVLVLVKVHLVNRSSSMTCSWLFKSWPPQNNWRFLGWRMLWHQPTWCLGGYFLGGILPQKWPKIEATVNDYSKIVIFSYFSAVCKKGFGGFWRFLDFWTSQQLTGWDIGICSHHPKNLRTSKSIVQRKPIKTNAAIPIHHQNPGLLGGPHEC